MNPWAYIRRAYVLPRPRSLPLESLPEATSCPECGYGVATLHRCPECGLSDFAIVEYSRNRQRAYTTFLLGLTWFAIGVAVSYVVAVMLSVARHPFANAAALGLPIGACSAVALLLVGPKRLLCPIARRQVTVWYVSASALPVGVLLLAALRS